MKLTAEQIAAIKAGLKPRQTAYADDDGCPFVTRRRVDLWEEDARALLADLEEARAALLSFSNFAYAYDDESFDPGYVLGDSDYGDITVGDLRRARKALAATEQEEK